MSFHTLVRAVDRYLEEEKAVLTAAGDPAGEAVLNRLGPARQALRREIDELTAWQTTPRAYSRIMVAVDDSEQARWALELAVRMAKTTGAALGVVHVVPEPGSVSPELAYAEPAIWEAQRRAAQQLLDDTVAGVPDGIEVSAVLHEGAAPRHICAAAKDWNADLIVIGTHGRGVLGRLLLGGTAESVVRHAHCPVLTVAHPPAPVTQLSEEPALAARPVRAEANPAAEVTASGS